MKDNFIIEKMFNETINDLRKKISTHQWNKKDIIEIVCGANTFLFNVYNIHQENTSGYLIIITDVTKIKNLEHWIVLLNSLIDKTPISIVLTDKDGMIVYANEYALKITGYNIEELVGKNPRIFKSGLTPQETYKNLWNTILSDNVWSGQLINKKKSGDIFTENAIIAPLKDPNEEICNFICFKEDNSEKSKLKEKVIYSETHEILTGLYNRIEFERRIRYCLDDNKKNKNIYFIAIINIDEFRIINNIIGYDVGDDLLKKFSEFVSASFPENLIISCLGGDEFAIIIPNIYDAFPNVEKETIDSIYVLCDNFRKSVEKWRFFWNETPFKITVSIGISYIDINSKTASSIISQASSACSEAKETGKNRIVVYREDENFIKREQQQKMFLKLKESLENDTLFLVFQKIVPVNPQKRIHYESLIRMRGENRIISPLDFLQVAENFQIVFDVDMWVVDRVFRYLKAIRKITKIDFIITINLSSKTVSDLRCLNVIIHLMDIYDIDPKTIGFEITETAAIINFNVAKKLINELKKLGCIVLLDDFGIGESSFSRFQEIPIDIVKIDGHFIKDLNTNKFNEGVVKSAIEISKIVQAEVVAECVHNKKVYEAALKLGIDYFQGYYFSKPLPICTVLCDIPTCLYLKNVDSCVKRKEIEGKISE